MKNSQKSFKIPEWQDTMKINQDQINTETVYGVNTHKIDQSDCVALSYHVVETVADGATKTIITPLSINTVQCQSFITDRVCSGSMGTSSQGSYYVFANWVSTTAWSSTTRMINLWVWTVTSTINGKTLTIANSWVWATITVILTFFA